MNIEMESASITSKRDAFEHNNEPLTEKHSTSLFRPIKGILISPFHCSIERRGMRYPGCLSRAIIFHRWKVDCFANFPLRKANLLTAVTLHSVVRLLPVKSCRVVYCLIVSRENVRIQVGREEAALGAVDGECQVTALGTCARPISTRRFINEISNSISRLIARIHVDRSN